MQCFKDNGPRYNLLNSALIEFFEFIRTVSFTLIWHGDLPGPFNLAILGGHPDTHGLRDGQPLGVLQGGHVREDLPGNAHPIRAIRGMERGMSASPDSLRL